MNTTSNFKSFDLPDFLAGTTSLYLRMQVLSSLAWRIDTLIVQQCRALFKLLKLTPLALTLDGDADLRAAITKGAWTEQLFAETGSSERTPLMQNLWMLTSMRLQAHQNAEDATLLVPWSNGQQRRYTVPEIDDLFAPNGGSTEPRGESLLRMQMSAERNANKLATGKDAKELSKRFLDARLRIERANLTSMQHNMALQTDTLIAIHRYAMDRYCDEAAGDFDKLHIDVQRVLIENAMNSADRAVQSAESNPKELSFDDFCHLLVETDKVKDHLKKVLAAPKFNGGIVTLRVKAGPTLADSKVKQETKHKAMIAKQLPIKPKTKRQTKTMVAKVEAALPKAPATNMADGFAKALEAQPNEV